MINLTELTSKELQALLSLRMKMEKVEREMVEILEAAKARPPTLAAQIRENPLPRKAQPTLRDLISGILDKAKKPMSVPEILEASIAVGYHWRSTDPINALNVKMYTDRTFKKAGPGRFVLRRKAT